MVLVGFGVYKERKEQRYWKVLHSWGKDFGLNGYMHVDPGRNYCRVEVIAFYPFLDSRRRRWKMRRENTIKPNKMRN